MPFTVKNKTTGKVIVSIVHTTNDEVIQVPGTADVEQWNYYPETIEITIPDGADPSQAPIDIFDLPTAGGYPGLGPLPSGSKLMSAGVFGPVTGQFYPATILTINDLSDLPTSSSNDSLITWDTSVFGQTSGPFFIARTTMPFGELLVPEPSSSSLVTAGLFGLAFAWRLRIDRAEGSRRSRDSWQLRR